MLTKLVSASMLCTRLYCVPGGAESAGAVVVTAAKGCAAGTLGFGVGYRERFVDFGESWPSGGVSSPLLKRPVKPV